MPDPVPSGGRASELGWPSELVKEAERVADRLRVVGPRMAARQSAAADAVLDDVHGVLQDLADAAARCAGRPRRGVPRLAPHALGDQLLVLAHDVASEADAAAVDGALAALRALKRRI
jgi:hypothetical protein